MLGVCWEQVFLESRLRVFLKPLDVGGEATNTLGVLLEKSQRGITPVAKQGSKLPGGVVVIHPEVGGRFAPQVGADWVRPYGHKFLSGEAVLSTHRAVPLAKTSGNRDFLTGSHPADVLPTGVFAPVSENPKFPTLPKLTVVRVAQALRN